MKKFLYIIVVLFVILIVNFTNKNVATSTKPIEQSTLKVSQQIQTSEELKPKSILFRVTAYCACKKCCGIWASKRPLDQNGNPIVYGASGEKLIPGVSCASTFPFGTQIELEGYGVVEVQDRTADWVVMMYGENIIDLYMDNHDEAIKFGVKYIEGVVK